MKLTLLTAGFPPDFDAIGEYSWWLGRELALQDHDVTVLTSKGRERSAPPDVQISLYSPPYLPDSLLTQDWVIVQYNPFAFGKWGYCSWLVKALQEIKKAGRCKIAVMFHEVFTDDAGLRPAIMRVWQAPQARAMAALANRVFVSCASYGKMLGRSSGTFLPLPVGSNLPEPSATPDPAARLRLGTFATSHPSHQFTLMAKSLKSVLAAGIDAEFLFVGSGGKTAAPYFASLPFTASGQVPAETASQLISTIDCFLCPFTDGLSTRRGSVVAGLQHSRALVSTSGSRTDSLLAHQNAQAFHLAPVGNENLFVQHAIDLCRDSAARGAMGRQGRMLFDRAFAWPVVAKTMTGYLLS